MSDAGLTEATLTLLEEKFTCVTTPNWSVMVASIVLALPRARLKLAGRETLHEESGGVGVDGPGVLSGQHHSFSCASLPTVWQ